MPDRPHNYIEAAAIISGPAALLIDSFLAKHLREWREHAAPLSKDMGLAVVDTVESIRRAADAYRETVGKRASLGGSGERKPAEAPQDSAVMEWISTSDASRLLGVTPRRVRQLLLLGELAGRRVDGSWQVDRFSVLERASR